MSLEKHYTCFYCSVEDLNVEAAGMWSCPNPMCHGPGAHWMRHKCKSYKEHNDGTHSVDDGDWKHSSLVYLVDRKELATKIRLTAKEQSNPFWGIK